ncbi:MAG TPA: type II toxin-antitoxin system RelE/ParE family toxin [Methylomirabilota bacterium]|nr:type II toxin-antitoxin system RelE/ParE family toxin [Methylomirabilota bacterium]
MKAFRFHWRAARDVEEASAFYEARDTEVAARFLQELNAVIERARLRPLLFRVVRANVRRALLRRFPYALLFVLKDELVVIIGVAHLSRMPTFWVNRL